MNRVEFHVHIRSPRRPRAIEAGPDVTNPDGDASDGPATIVLQTSPTTAKPCVETVTSASDRTIRQHRGEISERAIGTRATGHFANWTFATFLPALARGRFMRVIIRPSGAIFALVMIGFGVLGLIYVNSPVIWEPIPKTLPGRSTVIYLCALVELGTGAGLLLRPTLACRVLLPFLLLWLVLLKLPGVLHAPHIMVNWEAFAEVAAPLAGGWCLFAAHAGAWERRHLQLAVGGSGVRTARLLLIAALPMIGLSHFAYQDLTASLVPVWMHFPLGWTYLTGAASVAAAAGMLFGLYPRLAASLEAAMLWIITVLVWVPRLAAAPQDQGNWTEFVISAGIAAGAWVVADTYRAVPWLASGQAARRGISELRADSALRPRDTPLH